MKFEQLDSQPAYQGRAIKIRRDLLKTPSGRTAWYDIVEHPGSVVLVPVDGEGNILFVRQYRHPAGEILLELPAGTLEAGEAPADCAAREIREETGMASENIQKLGAYYLVPGYSTEYMHAFLATGLTHNPLDPDADEYLQVKRIPIAKAYEMAQTGEIEDAKSLAALMLAMPHISQKP